MTTPLSYRDLIETRGISLRELGIADTALTREDAILAADLLREAATPILGGDVYIKTQVGIEIAYANWHSDPRLNETRSQFADRSCLAAKRYITAYPSSGTTPMFGLVVERR